MNKKAGKKRKKEEKKSKEEALVKGITLFFFISLKFVSTTKGHEQK